MSDTDPESTETQGPDDCAMDTSLISDLLGMKHLSKPISKLIDVAGSAAGILYEPTRIRRKAKAEAHAAIIHAEAEAEIKDLQWRANNRLLNKELRRQKNIEPVLEGTVPLLPEQVSNEKPSEDWVYEFFNNCQDIGDNEMQILWSKILAGEVSKPGTYSLRTLNLLKTMTKEDVNLFTNLCSTAWKTHSNDYISIYTDSTDKYLSAKHITYPHQLHLKSIGLIEIESALGYNFEGHSLTFSYFGTSYRFSSINLAEILLVRLFTQIGGELVPISGASPDPFYIERLKDSLGPNTEMIPINEIESKTELPE